MTPREICDSVATGMLGDIEHNKDDDTWLTLGPEGTAALDGEFTAYELMRIAEAARYAAADCLKANGGVPPDDVPMDALLHALELLHQLVSAAGVTTLDYHRHLAALRMGMANIVQLNIKLAERIVVLAKELRTVAAERLELATRLDELAKGVVNPPPAAMVLTDNFGVTHVSAPPTREEPGHASEREEVPGGHQEPDAQTPVP